MKWRAVLIAAVVGFLLPTESPSQDKGPKPGKDEKEYAKVELKGRLSVRGRPGPGVQGPILEVRADRYGLDLSQQKDLQGEALRKLDGEMVIVTGRLRLHRNSMELTWVVVSSLRLVKDE